jgi:hypothetical protein
MEIKARGQYGKRNPLFQYQTAVGVSLPVDEEGNTGAAIGGKVTVEAINVTPSQSGTKRCGAER